jgi:hypothetical protein
MKMPYAQNGVLVVVGACARLAARLLAPQAWARCRSPGIADADLRIARRMLRLVFQSDLVWSRNVDHPVDRAFRRDWPAA